MKILNINKYFGANLISLFGYIIILFYFHYFFIYSTNISDVNKEITKQFGEDLTSGIYEGFYFASYFIIFLFLLLFFIIEILIRKKQIIIYIFLKELHLINFLLLYFG